MDIGKLDQQVQLQSLSETDFHGSIKQSWIDEALVPAHVLSQRGSESFEAARTNARQTIRVLMRFRDDVKETWRLKWDEKFWNIVYVDRSQKRQGELWLTAEVVGV